MVPGFPALVKSPSVPSYPKSSAKPGKKVEPLCKTKIKNDLLSPQERKTTNPRLREGSSILSPPTFKSNKSFKTSERFTEASSKQINSINSKNWGLANLTVKANFSGFLQELRSPVRKF